MSFVTYVNDLATKFHDVTSRGITTNIALTFPARMGSLHCKVTLYVMPKVMLLTSGISYSSKVIDCIENGMYVYDISTPNEEACSITFDTVEPYGAVDHWMTEHASLAIETVSKASAEVLLEHYTPKFKHVEVFTCS